VLAGKVCWGNVLDASLSGSREMSIQPAFIDSDSNCEFPANHSKIGTAAKLRWIANSIYF